MAEATAREQLLLELINRARMDPAGEALRQGINLNQGLSPGTISAAPKQVLAFNPFLNSAADAHSQWMLDTDNFAHTGAGGSSPGTRMDAAGYDFTGTWGWAENIAWSGTTGTLDGDAAVAGHHRNLFLSPGHRLNLLNGTFREAGLGSLTGAFTSGGQTYNSLMTTENFAVSGSTLFVTGVSYTDTDNNAFYSVGEGRAGLAVTLVQGGGAIASTATGTAGGFALGVAATGNVEVRFSGGGLTAVIGVAVTLDASNIKVDLVGGNTIASNASATLTQSAVNLTLIGIEAVNGGGNGLNNTLTGNAAANSLAGLGGNDLLFGGGGGDTLSAGAGNDGLSGGAGGDILSGGAGNDLLVGNAGADRLMGGTGIDCFRFLSAGDSSGVGDLILDFEDGIDTIDLRVIDAIAGGADQAFGILAAAASFNGAATVGMLRIYQTATRTVIEGETTGDGIADFQIRLDGLFNLTAADFLL